MCPMFYEHITLKRGGLFPNGCLQILRNRSSRRQPSSLSLVSMETNILASMATILACHTVVATQPGEVVVSAIFGILVHNSPSLKHRAFEPIDQRRKSRNRLTLLQAVKAAKILTRHKLDLCPVSELEATRTSNHLLLLLRLEIPVTDFVPSCKEVAVAGAVRQTHHKALT